MAVRGGRYADWLPEWWDGARPRRGEDRVVRGSGRRRRRRCVRDVAAWLGLDPDRLPDAGLRSENRTTAFRHARLQRVALVVQRHRRARGCGGCPGFKRRLRALYFRVNGRSDGPTQVADTGTAELADRFAEPNARLGRAARRRRHRTGPPGCADADSVLERDVGVLETVEVVISAATWRRAAPSPACGSGARRRGRYRAAMVPTTSRKTNAPPRLRGRRAAGGPARPRARTCRRRRWSAATPAGRSDGRAGGG